jgi:hypothetical protein
MPPQQFQRLLDFGDGVLDFRTHVCSSGYGLGPGAGGIAIGDSGGVRKEPGQ